MRIEGHFYPACQHKCFPILTFMLQGLKVEDNPLFARGQALLKQVHIVHEDDSMLVVYKPSGLLSVPSRNHGEVSLAEHLCSINPEIRLVHRLDQDTSGLLLAGKDIETCRRLQQQFVRHEVRKKYVAILETPLRPEQSCEGIISLPLSRNPFDSPRQVVNQRYGKPAITSTAHPLCPSRRARTPHQRRHSLRYSCRPPLSACRKHRLSASRHR